MIKVDNKVLCENCFAETDRIPCPECGFGITYLAYDLKLGCKVAVKEYYPYGLAARLPGSARIVVTGQDFFYENNTVYLTMSYLDGRTLKDYLREQGTLTPGQAVYVADAMCNARRQKNPESVV